MSDPFALYSQNIPSISFGPFGIGSLTDAQIAELAKAGVDITGTYGQTGIGTGTGTGTGTDTDTDTACRPLQYAYPTC